MDYYDQDQTLGAQPTVPEKPLPAKKKGFLKYIIIVLVALIILAGAWFAFQLYMRTSPQVRHISKNALFVTRIDLLQILKKGDMDEFKKESADDKLMEALESVNMEALVKDPKSTGLFTMKPAYCYGEFDPKENDFSFFFVLPIADADKVSKFVKGIDTGDKDREIDVKQKSGKYILDIGEDNDQFALAWNKQSLILGVGSDIDEQRVTEPGAAVKKSSLNLEKKVLASLDQTRAESIAATKHYNKDMAGRHDISIWINTDLIATMADKGFKDAKARIGDMLKARAEYQQKLQDYYAWRDTMYYYDSYNYGYYDYPEPPVYEGGQPENLFESILFYSDYSGEGDASKTMDMFLDNLGQLKGSSFMAYLDFKNGKIETGVKSNLSAEYINKYKGMFKNLASTKNLAKYLPVDNLVGTGIYSLNWDSAWNLMGKQYKQLLDSTAEDEGDDDLKRIVKQLPKACDGAVLACVNMASGKEQYPFATLAAATGKNAGLKQIVKDLNQNGNYRKTGKAYVNEYGDDAFIIEDDAVIWTTDYSKYKRCDLGIKDKNLKHSGSAPLGAFFDIAKFVDIFGDEMGDDAKDIFDVFTTATVTSKSSRGFPSETKIVINLKETKKNSLKVLWELIPNKDEMFEDFGLKAKVEEEDWNQRYDYDYNPDYQSPVDTTVETPYY